MIRPFYSTYLHAVRAHQAASADGGAISVISAGRRTRREGGLHRRSGVLIAAIVAEGIEGKAQAQDAGGQRIREHVAECSPADGDGVAAVARLHGRVVGARVAPAHVAPLAALRIKREEQMARVSNRALKTLIHELAERFERARASSPLSTCMAPPRTPARSTLLSSSGEIAERAFCAHAEKAAYGVGCHIAGPALRLVNFNRAGERAGTRALGKRFSPPPASSRSRGERSITRGRSPTASSACAAASPPGPPPVCMCVGIGAVSKKKGAGGEVLLWPSEGGGPARPAACARVRGDRSH